MTTGYIIIHKTSGRNLGWFPGETRTEAFNRARLADQDAYEFSLHEQHEVAPRLIVAGALNTAKDPQ